MHPCLSFRLSSHTCQGIFHRDVADIGRPVLSLLHRCCDIHFPSQTCPLGRLIHARYATHAFQMLSIGYALIDQRFRRPLCNSLLDPFSPWARNLQHQGSLYTHYERDTLYERDSVECSVCCLMSDTKISPAILPNVSTKHILQHKGKRKKKTAEDHSYSPESQQRKPHPAERLHKRLHHALVPPGRQLPDLVEVVAHPLDHVRRAGLVAEARPQVRLEDVLVDGRGDGDADRPAEAAREVYSREIQRLVGSGGWVSGWGGGSYTLPR